MGYQFPSSKVDEKKSHSVQASEPRKGVKLSYDDVLALEAT